MPIYISITVEVNRAEIATNRECNPKRWNGKERRAIGKKDDVRILNSHLDRLQDAIYHTYREVTDLGIPITAEAIKSSYLGNLSDTHMLL